MRTRSSAALAILLAGCSGGYPASSPSGAGSPPGQDSGGGGGTGPGAGGHAIGGAGGSGGAGGTAGAVGCVDGESRPCGSELGRCVPGVELCSAGSFGACTGVVPRPEECDGVDDDCNGVVDDGGGPCGGACELEFQPGAACDGPDSDLCSGDDSYVCDGMNAVRCSAGADNVELCNRIDDECDGLVDEGACMALSWARLVDSSRDTWAGRIVATADDGLLFVGAGHGPNLAVCSGQPDELLLPLVSGFVARVDAAGSPVWATAVPGERHWAVELADGRIAVVGRFEGTVTFVPGEASVTAFGRWDAFVLLLDPGGVPVAVSTIGPAEFGEPTALAALPDGGLAVAGYVMNGPAILGAGGPRTVAVREHFVAVFEPDLALRWAENTPYVAALAASSDGALYAVATIQQETWIAAGDPPMRHLVPRGSGSAALIRFDGAGLTQWLRYLDASVDLWIQTLAVSPDGRVALAGAFDESITIESPAGSLQVSRTQDSRRAVVAVGYTAAGDASWTAISDPAGDDQDASFGLAPTVDGGWLWSGQFAVRTRFDTGGSRETTLVAQAPLWRKAAFLVKLDRAGAFQWAKVPGSIWYLEVSAAPSGATYLGGRLRESATVAEGESGEQLIAVRSDLGFLGRYVDAP